MAIPLKVIEGVSSLLLPIVRRVFSPKVQEKALLVAMKKKGLKALAASRDFFILTQDDEDFDIDWIEDHLQLKNREEEKRWKRMRNLYLSTKKKVI